MRHLISFGIACFMINGYVIAMKQGDRQSQYSSSRQNVGALVAFLRNKKEEVERIRDERQKNMEKHLQQMNKDFKFGKFAEQSGKEKEKTGEIRMNNVELDIQKAKL